MSDLAFPRLVIAGTSSGVGKTTVTVALARALRARGLRVALFKCGPDYLDPTYHARAIDAPSQNLDGWMMGHEAVRATFAHAARDADISLIEGVMGLYDGASPTGEEGSTAEIAKWLEAPVVLVVDAGGMARSIAALVGGFASFDPKLHVAAAIANRVGSRSHLDLLRRALRTPPILGGFPRDEEHAFAERHLGLRTADESALPASLLDHWAEQASSWFSLDALLALATSVLPVPVPVRVPMPATSGCRIAIARDDAFHFYYADNLRRLESLGAELVPFSPMRDATLPDADGLYLGGGYPEVHAAALSANVAMREAVASFAQAGGPIYAECGGLMYLTQAIVTTDGERHPMVGLVPTEARMCAKLQALGYVEVETQTKTILGGAGSRFRGHQFRYSELSPEPPPSIERVYSLRRRRGDETSREGFRIGNVIASYVHAHWASNPRIAASFVESCAAYRKTRTP
ncbi:cobyrinate a,c-diamide synthase [Pendulispora brunnea]|uniref:Cobyrinate a,c-diamide synthase n=1 Tax=Pendulispora brunnea TaxID=2905690 RepID=A0ABZ2K8F7_9BACT